MAPKMEGDEPEDKSLEQKLEERIRTRTAAEPQDDDDDEPAAGDDDPEPTHEADQRERDRALDREPPREQKPKRNRWHEHTERARAAEARAAEYESKLQQAFQMIQTLQQAPQRQERSEPEVDPIKGEVDRIYEEQSLIYQRLQLQGGQLPKDELDKLDRRSRELEERKYELIAERTLKKNQPAPQDPRVAQLQALEAQFKVQFPDVYANPNGETYAEGVLKQEMAKGRPWSPALVTECLAAARAALRTAPTQAPRREPGPRAAERMAGLRSGPQSGAPEEQPAQLTTAQKRIARSMYPNLEDDKAFDQWRKGPGKRLQKQLAGA